MVLHVAVKEAERKNIPRSQPHLMGIYSVTRQTGGMMISCLRIE
jgi:hypothetical protein